MVVGFLQEHYTHKSLTACMHETGAVVVEESEREGRKGGRE